jgi:hypothetical protein
MTGEVPLINGLLVPWIINGNYVNYYGLLINYGNYGLLINGVDISTAINCTPRPRHGPLQGHIMGHVMYTNPSPQRPLPSSLDGCFA